LLPSSGASTTTGTTGAQVSTRLNERVYEEEKKNLTAKFS
jgi:hypothetical protein